MIDDLSLLELSSISPSVRALLEDEMNKQRKNRILEKHKYAINQCADGRWCTTYYENAAIIERTHADTNFEEYKKALNREKTQLRAL